MQFSSRIIKTMHWIQMNRISIITFLMTTIMANYFIRSEFLRFFCKAVNYFNTWLNSPAGNMNVSSILWPRLESIANFERYVLIAQSAIFLRHYILFILLKYIFQQHSGTCHMALMPVIMKDTNNIRSGMYEIYLNPPGKCLVLGITLTPN